MTVLFLFTLFFFSYIWGENGEERQTRMLTTPFILPKPGVPLQDRLAGFQKDKVFERPSPAPLCEQSPTPQQIEQKDMMG